MLTVYLMCFLGNKLQSNYFCNSTKGFFFKFNVKGLSYVLCNEFTGEGTNNSIILSYFKIQVKNIMELEAKGKGLSIFKNNLI